jgi:serine O-acetyltransferase
MALFDARFKDDLRRYPPKPWVREQSIWAIAILRFGQRNDQRRRGPVKWLFGRLYWLFYRVAETLTGVSIPKSVRVGGGLRIHHFGCIFINAKSVIGSNCTLRQGVTIGNRHDDGPVPVIGDGVEFGAYAQVLGDVRIGNGARIGAMSVVLCDVPEGATAVGIPAKIIQPKAPAPPAAPSTEAAPAESTT